MSEYVNLIGAEDVRSAGASMREAAEKMRSACESLSWSLDQHKRTMDRLIELMEESAQREIAAKEPKA